MKIKSRILLTSAVFLILFGIIIYQRQVISNLNQNISEKSPSSSVENVSEKTESPEIAEVENSEVKEGVSLRGEHEFNWNVLEVIDINGDGQEEIINYVRTASWFNSIYILTPSSDGTLKLFCEHCHFIYYGGFGKIEFVDINNDKKMEVKLWGASDGININKNKEPEIYYFINNDFIKK